VVILVKNKKGDFWATSVPGGRGLHWFLVAGTQPFPAQIPEDLDGKGGRRPPRPCSLPGASGLSSLRGQRNLVSTRGCSSPRLQEILQNLSQ